MIHYRNCIAFVAVILGMGALLTALFGGSPTALVIVAVSVFVASLVISKTNPLNGEAVDRTYYTSAMLGACLYFYAQSVERTEFLGYRDLAELRSQLEDSQSTVDRLEIDVENGTGAARFIRENEEQSVREISREIAEFRSLQIEMNAAELDACLIGSGFDFGATDFGLDEPSGVDAIIDDHQKEVERVFAQQMCSAARTRIEQERAIFVENYPLATRFSDIEQTVLKERGISQRLVQLGGYSVTIGTASAVFSGEFSMAEHITALEEAQTVLKQKIDDVRSKSGEITDEIEKEKERSASTIGQIALFIWPYVLIALLGLKLSRAPRKNTPQLG
ncbi:hypothetical protein [Ruegeria arenilitoris]|uniref:hypothetical protein n=1 Tax=Ruegeria arenilitoris TaxID=1173585 RepID=UPI00147A04A6|nr:hypothetical protein [Ruegeria arenilitoris]